MRWYRCRRYTRKLCGTDHSHSPRRAVFLRGLALVRLRARCSLARTLRLPLTSQRASPRTTAGVNDFIGHPGPHHDLLWMDRAVHSQHLGGRAIESSPHVIWARLMTAVKAARSGA